LPIGKRKKVRGRISSLAGSLKVILKNHRVTLRGKREQKKISIAIPEGRDLKKVGEPAPNKGRSDLALKTRGGGGKKGIV